MAEQIVLFDLVGGVRYKPYGMESSDIIAGVALLVSVASFAYGVRAARQNRRIQAIEKRVKLLASATELVILQEKIAVEASRLSHLPGSDRDFWKDLSIHKRDFANEMRDTYDKLLIRDSTNMVFFHTLETSINDMLETARCDLEWLQKAQSDIVRAEGKTIETKHK